MIDRARSPGQVASFVARRIERARATTRATIRLDLVRVIGVAALVLGVLGVLGLLGCGARSGGAPPNGSSPGSSAGTTPAPVSPGDPACDTNASALTVALVAGQTIETATGVAVTFVGTGHDDFGDGRFDDWVSLQFRRDGSVEDRMVSLHAPPRAERLFYGCWKLIGLVDRKLTLVFLPATR
jgi:hypothetical protein